MLAWTVLTLLFTISLVIIGLRRWEGWMVASLINVGWISYSLVGGVRVVELVVNFVGLAVTVFFAVRWNRAQRLIDEDAAERVPALTS